MLILRVCYLQKHLLELDATFFFINKTLTAACIIWKQALSKTVGKSIVTSFTPWYCYNADWQFRKLLILTAWTSLCKTFSVRMTVGQLSSKIVRGLITRGGTLEAHARMEGHVHLFFVRCVISALRDQSICPLTVFIELLRAFRTNLDISELWFWTFDVDRCVLARALPFS